MLGGTGSFRYITSPSFLFNPANATPARVPPHNPLHPHNIRHPLLRDLRPGADPQSWHWMAVVAPYHLGYFAFLGADLVGITYAIDSFPCKAGPLLLVICAGRGLISFGLSYATVPLVDLTGSDGAMEIFAIIAGVLGAATVPAYVWGRRVRMWATRRFWPEAAV